MKFNFVIFASKFYVYETSYGDVSGLKNVRYINDPIAKKNKFIKLLYRIHHSNRINKYLKLPFKQIWFKSYFVNNFVENKPICFLFFRDTLYLEKLGYIDYLKSKYDDSKFVVFFQDLISLYPNIIDIEHCKNIFDLVLSFDQAESKKYELVYHQLVFSHIPIKKSKGISDCDIYFLGKAKNRLEEIIKTYEYLKSQNLKCDFYLVGVEPNKQVYPDEIHYIEDMPYIENLQHVVSTRCLLEIMQQGGHGYTQRMCEAIAYDKKILTNNVEVKEAPFYNPKYISIFSDISDIDITFLNDGSDYKVDYNYKEKISPKELLLFIQEKINNK